MDVSKNGLVQIDEALKRFTRDDSKASVKIVEPLGINLRDMELSMNQFLNYLITPIDSFKSETAFVSLKDYLQKYQRLLYSTITLFVYAKTEIDAKKSESNVQNLVYNLERVIDYLDDPSKISALKKSTDVDQKSIDVTKKALWKVWDHVNLAHRQYADLKQTDEEYNQKFEERISKFQTKLTSDISSQLLSLVSIFTALAFILFGGIGSLQNVFSSLHESDLLKLMIIACVWGIGMLNIVFVFLFCIAKMTKLPLSANTDEGGTIWQRYAIFWWSDLILLSLMMIFIWIYYFKEAGGGTWISQLVAADPKAIGLIGTILILCAIIRMMLSLYEVTMAPEVKKAEEAKEEDS